VFFLIVGETLEDCGLGEANAGFRLATREAAGHPVRMMRFQVGRDNGAWDQGKGRSRSLRDDEQEGAAKEYSEDAGD
jgi:predicted NUDIX family NTP pyrophosphohydrolase